MKIIHLLITIIAIACSYTSLALAANQASNTIQIHDALIDEMTPNSTTSEGSFTIINGGKTADQVMSFRSDSFELVMLKKDALETEVTAIIIPANSKVNLKDQGIRLMFKGVKSQWIAGDNIKATIEFKHAGPMVVNLKVIAIEGLQTIPSLDIF